MMITFSIAGTACSSRKPLASSAARRGRLVSLHDGGRERSASALSHATRGRAPGYHVHQSLERLGAGSWAATSAGAASGDDRHGRAPAPAHAGNAQTRSGGLRATGRGRLGPRRADRTVQRLFGDDVPGSEVPGALPGAANGGPQRASFRPQSQPHTEAR